eukprot:8510958-Alexandrium_andersonii.AAC.1
MAKQPSQKAGVRQSWRPPSFSTQPWGGPCGWGSPPTLKRFQASGRTLRPFGEASTAASSSCAWAPDPILAKGPVVA